MGLRLRFQLTARSTVVRDDAAMLVDLLALLEREGLLDDAGATLTITHTDGRVETTASLSLQRLRERLGDAAAQRPRAATVQGLHTRDGFPNPFWQYTHGQDVIVAWMNLRWVGQPAAFREFALEFVEPEFLSDRAVFAPTRLAARLKTVVGTTLAPQCESVEPPPEIGAPS